MTYPPESYGAAPDARYGPPPVAAPVGKLKKPGRIPLRLALIFGVVGLALVVVGSVLLANGLLNKIDGFARIGIAQGQRTVQLDRVGAYIGYYETPTHESHKAYVQMRITDSSGDPVPIHLYATNTHLTYTRGTRFGQALFTFRIEKAGRYQVQLRSDDAAAGADVALGESVANGLVTGVALIVPGALLVIAAIVLLIVGIVRRTSFTRRQREMATRPQWGYQ